MKPRPWLRPAVHAGALGFVYLAPILGDSGMAAVATAAFFVNALVLPRTAFGRALRREGEPPWNGLVSYPIAVAIGFALFPPEAAAAAWACLAVGDPVAAWAGRRAEGWPRIPWNRRKSLAGMLTFVSAAWIAASLVVATAMPEVMGIPSARLLRDGTALALYLCWTATGAFIGAVVETFDLGIDDNLPVALAVGGTLTLLGTG